MNDQHQPPLQDQTTGQPTAKPAAQPTVQSADQPSAQPADQSAPLPPLSPALEEEMRNAEEELRRFDEEPLHNTGLFTRAFSFNGRITRTEYAVSYATIALWALVGCRITDVWATFTTFVVDASAGDATAVAIWKAAVVPLVWFLLAQGAKRLHDVGRSGWWILVPFVCLLLFFPRGSQATNKYGLPARLRTTVPSQCAENTCRRRHGLFAALAWWLFSPAYLYLVWRWKMQKTLARIVMIGVSPLIVGSCCTLKSCSEKANAVESRIAVAQEVMKSSSIGIALPVEEYVLETKPGQKRHMQFSLLLSHPVGTKERTALTAAAEKGNGWEAFDNESTAFSTDDYGYYREDYLNGATHAAAPTFFRLTREVTAESKRYTLSLSLSANDSVAHLTLTEIK